MSKLQVLIATYGREGLLRIARMFHPVIDGVEYLVSCQGAPEPIPLPEKLRRPDFKVEFHDDRGLSRNRNHLLRMASAPVCLIADDDLDFFEEGLKGIISAFAENPNLDLAAFRYILDSGGFEKFYPDIPFPLTKWPKGYYVTSFELAFRRESVAERKILFNEQFGVGCSRYLPPSRTHHGEPQAQ